MMDYFCDSCSVTATIVNDLGLHARSAARIAAIAQQAKSSIWVLKDGKKADAKSVIDVLTLECGKGSEIVLTAEDRADEGVLHSIKKLVNGGFRDQKKMAGAETQETTLIGIGGSPGICIGKAYLVDREGVDVVEKYTIGESNLKNEVQRFKAAVKRAKDELDLIIAGAPEELRQHAYILETHIVLLKDKMLYGKTIDTIRKERVNAEWALKKVVSELKTTFQNVSDQYLKERGEDVVHVSEIIIRNLVGAEAVNIAGIDKRVILVAHDLSPAQTSQINLERIKGFVTDRGGRSSHTSIIARTLEIPAVLGLDNATASIKNDDMIIVDGTAGKVIVNPDEQTLADYEERGIRYENFRAVIARSGHLQAETPDGLHLRVMGNIELPEEVTSVIRYGGDGIGLYRTEFQYLSRPDFPTEEELFDKYRDVVEVMAPRPVTIRTLDINGDKALAQDSYMEEDNPALGLRAIRYCLKNPEVFKTQLRAILRAAVYGNVRVLFPMISSNDEVLEAKQIMQEAADSLEKDGVEYNKNLETGILIEVPSAVIMADVMAENVDFFSIGTNDLIQYSMAIDRGNMQVAHLYQPLHPAVIRMIKHVADVSRDKGIKVFMCGEMAGDPINVPVLLGMGFDELSMNPPSIPAVKSMIRSIKAKDARRLVAEVMTLRRPRDVIELVEGVYGSIISEKSYSA